MFCFFFYLDSIYCIHFFIFVTFDLSEIGLKKCLFSFIVNVAFFLKKEKVNNKSSLIVNLCLAFRIKF